MGIPYFPPKITKENEEKKKCIIFKKGILIFFESLFFYYLQEPYKILIEYKCTRADSRNTMNQNQSP